MSPFKMEDLMQSLYSNILPILGVNRYTTNEWWMLGARFQGLGLPNFVVLCFAGRVFFMKFHVGFDDAA